MYPRRYLTNAELGRFMDVVRNLGHASQPRDYALFALLANTGIRPGEALALTRADIHPHVRPAWIRIQRLKKRRAVAPYDDIEISARLAEILAAYDVTLPPGSAQPIFGIERRAAQRAFKRYARRARLWSGFHLYTLRHTAATRMYLATRDIKVVQAMLGHESPDTSCIYAHVPRSLLRSTFDTMPVFV